MWKPKLMSNCKLEDKITDLRASYGCSLSEGGSPPRFLIIDDGWQQIENKSLKDTNAVVQEGAQYESFPLSFIKAVIMNLPLSVNYTNGIHGKSCFAKNITPCIDNKFLMLVKNLV